MRKERIKAKVSDLVLNEGQLGWLPTNPRQWTQSDVDKTKASLKNDEDFMEDRPIMVLQCDGKLLVFAGNLRTTAAKALKWQVIDAVLYIPESDEDKETIKRRSILDNGAFGSWDYDMLANEWDDLPLPEWGVPAWDTENLESVSAPKEVEEDEIERKKREFEERMAAGEISEEDEEYQEFLEKFKLKKTTDDCYTPAPVYDRVAQYVAETYGVNPSSFIRPFYPGGDYQNENYPKGCVVVDNPPFSIMAEILNFYNERGIRFFLFAPTLTLFSSSSSSCTALPCTCAVIYENGASVNTSFLTNLEPKHIRLRSAPKLQAMVQEGIDEFAKTLKRSLPKYSYPPYIITSTFVGILSRLGIEFSVPVSESESISGLDAQKPSGKGIYGKGYIVSEAVKAEREKAEREKAERWELSEREYAIIDKLNKKKGTK